MPRSDTRACASWSASTLARIDPTITTQSMILCTRRGITRYALIAPSLDLAIACAGKDDEIFVVGGGELYREALPSANRLYLTVVDAEPEGDTLMPEIDFAHWREVSSEQHEPDEKHAYAYRFSVFDRAP